MNYALGSRAERWEGGRDGLCQEIWKAWSQRGPQLSLQRLSPEGSPGSVQPFLGHGTMPTVPGLVVLEHFQDVPTAW